MRFTIFSLCLASIASAAPALESALETRTIEPRALQCSVGSTVLDGFDNVRVTAALPAINGLLGATPKGSYLSYQNFGYGNLADPILTLPAPSQPNLIFNVAGTTGIITPTYGGANSFDLGNFRYACISRTATDTVAVPATCQFTIICSSYKSQTLLQKTFVYSQTGLVGNAFDTASFDSTFTDLAQCNIRLAGGLALDGSVTVLLIDNIANRGLYCQNNNNNNNNNNNYGNGFGNGNGNNYGNGNNNNNNNNGYGTSNNNNFGNGRNGHW